MKRGLGIGVCVLVFLGSGAVADEDSDQIARLEYWQQTPLDLSRADVNEIALLPGMDPELAAAVVGLRGLGELSSVDDLTRIPGIDAIAVEVLRPYVQLGSGVVDFGARWRLVAQGRGQQGPRWRQDLHSRSGPVAIDIMASDSSRELRRGAVVLESRDSRLAGGFLVLADGPVGILRIAPSRSRLAPAPRPRSPAVRARTDSGMDAGWVGVAAARADRGLIFLGRGPAGQTVGALSVRGDFGPLRLGVATRAGDGPLGLSVYLLREERRFAVWSGLVVEGDARGTALSARAKGQGWQAGLDASTTDGALTRGTDAVTGHRLDRSHQVMQLHGRVRGSGWSAGTIWRQLRRGRLGSVVPSTAVEFDASWRPQARTGPDHVRLQLRAAPTMRATLSARFPFGPHRFRVRFSKDEGSELVGGEYLRGFRRSEFRLAFAGVDGMGSRVWMLSRPGTGVYPVWLRPQEVLGATGFRWGGEAASVGVWIWGRTGASRDPDGGLGIACSLGAGKVVRRLQGFEATGSADRGAAVARDPRIRRPDP